MSDFPSSTRGDRGIALIGVIIALALLMALAATLAVSVTIDTQLRGAFGQGVSGFYAAESGLNKGMAEFKNLFLDLRVPTASDLSSRSYTLSNRRVDFYLSERPGNPESITIPAGELFAGLNSIQYTYTVNSSATNLNTSQQEASVGAEFLVGNIPIFQFAAFYEKDLEILPGPEKHLVGRVHTNGDLYLDSGNGLFLEDKPAIGVTTVQVSAAGDIYRGRKETSDCGGPVTVDMLEDIVAPSPDLDPRDLPCGGAATRQVPVAELAAWKGSIVSQIESITTPEMDIVQVGSGEFWKRADLRIALVLGTSGHLGAGSVLPHSIEVLNVTGARDDALTTQLHTFMSDETFNATSSSMPGTMPIFYTDIPAAGVGPAPASLSCNCSDANPGCANNGNPDCYSPVFPSADRVYSSNMTDNNQQPTAGLFDDDYRRGGFYNYREQKWMLLLNVNVADLLQWNQDNGNPFFPPGDATDGGLVIFATVVGPNSGAINNYGVRLFGSANLPIPGGIDLSSDPTGITFVTDQSMYVIGDYNRASGGGDLPKQPAAVIGDSLNVLSNNYWHLGCVTNCSYNDAQSPKSLGDATRLGTSTRISAAFLAGVDDSSHGVYPDDYNGGLENYPRFHEDWSGQTLDYSGSFVSLGNPSHVNGPWSIQSYSPPMRNWDYEFDYSDAANLPPLTPRFVYVQQVLFTQDFK